MMEKEWLTCADPGKLLRNLGRNPSKRKRRLFACACCRRIGSLIGDERSQSAIVTAEQFADGAVGIDELNRAKVQAKAAFEEENHGEPPYTGRWAAGACYCAVGKNAGDAAKAWHSATSASQMNGLVQHDGAYNSDDAVMAEVWNRELPIQAALVRDIFGNPFRPVALDPAWLTSTVVALASQMYESRDFSEMPILADALQDAGCDNPDMLDHCRGAGPHVRGCWVVDLTLGKA